jgi:hypothetical protein
MATSESTALECKKLRDMLKKQRDQELAREVEKKKAD